MKSIYILVVALLSLNVNSKEYLHRNMEANITIHKSPDIISVDSRPQNNNEQIKINTNFEKYFITGMILKITSEAENIDPEKYNKMLIEVNSKAFPDTKIIETSKISVKFRNTEQTGSLIRTNYHEKSTSMCDINTAFLIKKTNFILFLNLTTTNELCENNIDEVTKDIRNIFKAIEIVN